MTRLCLAVLLLAAACARQPEPEATGEPLPDPAPIPLEAMPGARGTCTADADCRPTGCGGILCASEELMSTCEFRPEHACYRPPTTTCGCFEGRCSWAPTDELRACLEKAARAP